MSAARSYSAECVTRAVDEGPGGRRRHIGRQRQVDLAVDLGRLALVAAHQQVLGLVGRPLDQHLERLAAHRPQLLLGDLALDAHQLAAARSTSFCGTRLGSSAATVPSSREKVKTPTRSNSASRTKSHRLLKGRVGLARVADDEGGAAA